MFVPNISKGLKNLKTASLKVNKWKTGLLKANNSEGLKASISQPAAASTTNTEQHTQYEIKNELRLNMTTFKRLQFKQQVGRVPRKDGWCAVTSSQNWNQNIADTGS